MLTKTDWEYAYGQVIRISGREPFIGWRQSTITVQIQNGRSTHQLVLQAPFVLPDMKPGDKLVLSFVRARIVKNWLGRLLARFQ